MFVGFRPSTQPMRYFQRYVRKGLYNVNWGAGEDMSFDETIGNE
jgi:hypothetical protein